MAFDVVVAVLARRRRRCYISRPVHTKPTRTGPSTSTTQSHGAPASQHTKTQTANRLCAFHPRDCSQPHSHTTNSLLLLALDFT